MCDICGVNGGHNKHCPYYEPPVAIHYCSICDDGIYEGEEYIENIDGEYVHYDCVNNMRELIEFLGGKVRTME